MSFSSVALITSTLFTRFFGINWGGGFFFNPDENNMVHAIMRMSSGEMNPHFFAYGQFPLYLTYFTRNLLRLDQSYEVTTLVLRFWSAMFSAISVFVFYKIVKMMFSTRTASLATLLYIFTPGLIQLSHFGTTESLLILIYLTNILLSFHLIKYPLDFKIYFLTSLTTGIGMASKLSSLIFLFPILFISLLNFFQAKSKLKTTLMVFLTVLLVLIFFIIFSPYNIIENKDFLSALRYETDVASGKMHVFYTNQFLTATPYIFQLQRIFPYVISIPICLLAFVGIFCIPFKKIDKKLIVLFCSVLLYFLYFGQLYVKWTRFMSPIFFIFPLLASIAIAKINSKLVRTFIIFISIIPGIYYFRLYLYPDIRVTASEWMNSNMPTDSKVLSEGGNVIDIPLDGGKFDVTNFDFYSLENNTQSREKLISKVVESDYIIVPSRRVFMNQVGPVFPTSHLYYQALFNGSLGFSPFKSFSINTELVLNQEIAEETWTVFDHPTIRIFKKNGIVPPEEYEKILNP